MILSAGVIHSPPLLLLSGIGPTEDLNAVGVAARHDLPGVRRNLQDHPFVTLIWEVSDQNTLYGADKAKAARRMGIASHRPANFERRRGPRVRAHALGPAGGGHPVPQGGRLLRGSRSGDLRWPLRGHRACARFTAGARPSLAALGSTRLERVG